MNGMTEKQVAEYTAIISSMTTEEINKRYELNRTNRHKNLTCLVEKQASLNLEILFDREINKRAAALMSNALNELEFGA